nr:ATP-binding cassette domain-containing protein [Microtetraspora sp. NBRC 16547]
MTRRSIRPRHPARPGHRRRPDRGRAAAAPRPPAPAPGVLLPRRDAVHPRAEHLRPVRLLGGRPHRAVARRGLLHGPGPDGVRAGAVPDGPVRRGRRRRRPRARRAGRSGGRTLLHLIGGMDLPDAGEIVIDDRPLPRRKLDAHRRRVGFVFQRFHLLPALSVLDNVLAPVLPYRVDFDRKARARELLEAVGLAGRERATPGELSEGSSSGWRSPARSSAGSGDPPGRRTAETPRRTNPGAATR